MVSSRASRSRVDMGQLSSQPQSPPAKSSAMKDPGKSKDRKGKSKKSKRKSAEMEIPIDQEEESALALMHMSEAPVHDGVAPYYEDKQTASAQVMTANSSMRPSTDPYFDETEPVRRSKRGKTNNKRVMKRGRSDVYEFTGSEEPSNEPNEYPDLPSTPPRQIDRLSPSPYHPRIPQANALDEIPTDDEDVAAYEKYAKDTASAEPPGMVDHDIFSFSQQPPNPFDQEQAGQGMHATYQLPANVYALPQDAEKQKKKKKRKKRKDDKEEEQHDFSFQQGQHTRHSDLEAFDDFLEIDMSPANLFQQHKDDNMPIDPELHSMNTHPPSADPSNLNDEDINFLQENGRGSGKHGSSQPRKRRRLEELQGANTTDLPYMSPYAFQHDQENIQDQVLPGFEDMQRQTSPELGSPFLDSAPDGHTEFSNNGVQSKESARGKRKGEFQKARRKKEREDSQKRDKIERSIKDKAENGGAFSTAEGLKLDAFRDNHCEANDMTISQFNNLIQTQMRGNAQVTALFNEIHDILPYRPRMSVQKFCRRRFHNYSRGTWSAEEDEMLKHAVAEKGKAWKEIGDSLGRMPEDCRDRYRNYLVNSEHRNREQWTDAEVVNLCTAILECMQLMKEDRMRAQEEGDAPDAGTESDQEVEDMKHINWQSVSDRMGEHGGGRSRLQCSFKWGQLKKREQADYLKAIKESREIEKKKATPVKNPWRMKLASKKVANMKLGDIHAFLQAVLDSGVPEEGNIPWKSLGDDQFRVTWTSTDKKAAWSTFKEQVAGSESMGYRSVAKEILSRIMNEGADALDERWDPELHGDVSAKKGKGERKPGKKKDKGKAREEFDSTNRHLRRSDEYVYDSDDMNGDAEDATRLGAFEPEGYNMYNALPGSDGVDGGMYASNRAGLRTSDDHGDLFNDQTNTNGHLGLGDEDVPPDLAGRVQMLNAYEKESG